MSVVGEVPIYQAMFDAGIVNQLMFNICLGRNGGYFQIGGFNTDHHLEPVKWFNMRKNSGSSYTFALQSAAMGNIPFKNSESWNVAFVDSGTTFSYIPTSMWDSLATYFDNWCSAAKA